MKSQSLKKQMLSYVAIFTLGLIASVSAVAQNGSFAGRYEGTAKKPDGDIALTMELTESAGKFSGQVTSPHGVYTITTAQVTDGALIFEAECNGSKGKATLRQQGEMLKGEFTVDGRTGSVEFKKAAAVDDISGEWDAIADASGQPFPFTLTLKLEGEKITGSSNSQLGTSTVTSGSWKDGKFAVILESGNGPVALAATMVEGKLSGDYDFAGQLQGKWVAIRKK